MVRRNRPKQLPEDITKPMGQDLRDVLRKAQSASARVAIDSEHYRALDGLIAALFDALKVLAPDQVPSPYGQSTAGFGRKTN